MPSDHVDEPCLQKLADHEGETKAFAFQNHQKEDLEVVMPPDRPDESSLQKLFSCSKANGKDATPPDAKMQTNRGT